MEHVLGIPDIVNLNLQVDETKLEMLQTGEVDGRLCHAFLHVVTRFDCLRLKQRSEIVIQETLQMQRHCVTRLSPVTKK